jgi:hypothetical protein
MRQRSAILPLALGLAFSLGLHLAVGVTYVHSRMVAAMPDLVAESLTGDDPFTAGQPATIVLDIANAGQASVDGVTIRWQLDGQTVATTTTDQRLTPGITLSVSQMFTGIEPGVHTVRATVDPQQQVDETSKTNNTIEATFVWRDASSGNSADVALPDLLLVDIQPATPLIAGKPARLLVRAANIGFGNAGPCVLRIDLDDKLLTELPLADGIGSGQVATLPIDIKLDEPGEHVVCAMVDSDDVVRETREDNNANCQRLTWQAEEEPFLGALEGEALQMRLVSADEFEQIRTPYESQLEQPMIQTTADPTPLAPVEIVDPTTTTQNSPEIASASPAQRPTEPTPPTPPTTAERPVQPDEPEGGAVEPGLEEVDEAQRAPASDDAADEAAAPADGEVEPLGPVDADGESDRINVLIDQTPRTTEVDDRANFEGDAEAVVQNIQPPVAPTDPDDQSDLPQAIDHGQVATTVDQEGSKTDPDENADPADGTLEVASAQTVPARLPTMPIEPDRSALPVSPDAESADDATDRVSESPIDKADEPAPPTRDVEEQLPVDQLQPPREPQPQTQPTPAVAPSQPSQANPTSAMRSDAESPPVSRIDYAQIKPGGVAAVRGVRIKTVVPRYSTVARMVSVPANPTYRVTFNGQGEVTKVEQLKSTGYINVDAPIITAIYKWTAQGKFDPDGFVIDQLDIKLGMNDQ